MTPEELQAMLAAERAGEPFVTFKDGDGVRRVFALTGDRISVGRDDGNELALGWDPEASRVHALLEPLGGSWTVVDDRLSRNGTFVNGTRVRGRRRLDDHDMVRFGTTEVEFRDPSQTGAATPQVSSHAAVAGITPAQQRVLVALCRPLIEAVDQASAPPSNPEIAAELTVSVEAIRTHLKTLFRLFEVPDLPQNRKRAELARRALASGVVAAQDLSD
jgi:hypothetical protein